MPKLDHLSYSSINQYLGCGLKFRFRKIDRLDPEFTSDALVFGSSMHRTLAFLNKHRFQDKTISPAEIREHFEAGFARENERQNIRYKNGNDFETCLEKGRKLLDVFHAETGKNEYEIVDIEKEFYLQNDNLNGSITHL